jgi:hypothetical protein
MATITVSNDLEDFSVDLCVNEGRPTITIRDYKGKSENVIVPAFIGGIPVDEIGAQAFYKRGEKITHITLPEGIVTIRDSAFEGCTALTGIDLPKSLVCIAKEAFKDCKQLASIDLPEGLVSIGISAFEGCAALTGVKLPESLTVIGDTAFKNCKQLAGINFPLGLYDFGDHVFAGCDKLTEEVLDDILDKDKLEDFSVNLNVNEGRTTIGIEYYYGKSEKVVVPASIGGIPVTAIEGIGFYNHEEIKQFVLPEGLVSIGDSAFNCCTALTSINLPESLVSIEAWAFRGCTALADINLPQSLTSIGGAAFEGCTALTSINLPENLISIGYDAFKDCAQLTNINLPKGLVDIGGAAFAGCSKLTELTVDEDNPIFTVVDGVLFDKAMTTLILYPPGKKGEYTIPDGVISVQNSAFKDCGEFTRIHFPQSLTDCGYSLCSCSALTAITVSGHNPEYSGIDGVLFNKGGAALLRYPKGRENKDYVVPDGVISIEGSAFVGCERLGAITLPMSCQYIISEGNVFEGCTNLETITLSRNTRIGYKSLEGFSGKLVYRD